MGRHISPDAAGAEACDPIGLQLEEWQHFVEDSVGVVGSCPAQEAFAALVAVAVDSCNCC